MATATKQTGHTFRTADGGTTHFASKDQITLDACQEQDLFFDLMEKFAYQVPVSAQDPQGPKKKVYRLRSATGLWVEFTRAKYITKEAITENATFEALLQRHLDDDDDISDTDTLMDAGTKENEEKKEEKPSGGGNVGSEAEASNTDKNGQGVITPDTKSAVAEDKQGQKAEGSNAPSFEVVTKNLASLFTAMSAGLSSTSTKPPKEHRAEIPTYEEGSDDDIECLGPVPFKSSSSKKRAAPPSPDESSKKSKHGSGSKRRPKRVIPDSDAESDGDDSSSSLPDLTFSDELVPHKQVKQHASTSLSKKSNKVKVSSKSPATTVDSLGNSAEARDDMPYRTKDSFRGIEYSEEQLRRGVPYDGPLLTNAITAKFDVKMRRAFLYTMGVPFDLWRTRRAKDELNALDTANEEWKEWFKKWKGSAHAANITIKDFDIHTKYLAEVFMEKREKGQTS